MIVSKLMLLGNHESSLHPVLNCCKHIIREREWGWCCTSFLHSNPTYVNHNSQKNINEGLKWVIVNHHSNAVEMPNEKFVIPNCGSHPLQVVLPL